MKVLVIPDVHLKPWMFQRADELMKEKAAERTVCLMDIADDWDKQFHLELYEETYDAAIRYAGEYPDTLWCYGNHDVCYLWNKRESGYSVIAPRLVCRKLHELREALPDPGQLAYIHRLDRVIFSHGGLIQEFIDRYVTGKNADTDELLAEINAFGSYEMWQGISPIWFRPQRSGREMYQPLEYMQVVGHTPVKRIIREDNIISCDVFSTQRDGEPIGTQEFLIIDTRTWEYEAVKMEKLTL